MNKVSIGLCTIGVASAAAPLCTTTPDVLDADLALKICIAFRRLLLQFLRCRGSSCSGILRTTSP